MLWYYDAIGKVSESLVAETEQLRQKLIDHEAAYRTAEDRSTID